MKAFRLAAAVVSTLLVTACGGSSGPQALGQKLVVVSTVTQVSALARAVGGDHIELTALLTSHDDPHAFEPKPADVAALSKSKLVIKSGAGLDGWIDRSAVAAAPKTPVLDLSTKVQLRDGEAGKDPHWWYDADNAKDATDAIAAELGRLDPSNRAAYEANAKALKVRLDEADIKIHGVIDVVPAEQRLFVGNHDALSYFLARYDITLVGDIIPSTDSLAAVRPADTAKLIADIKARQVRAIFTETTLSGDLAQQIARESGARVVDGKLYADAIGDPGSDGATLEGALVHNGQLLADGFKG